MSAAAFKIPGIRIFAVAAGLCCAFLICASQPTTAAENVAESAVTKTAEETESTEDASAAQERRRPGIPADASDNLAIPLRPEDATRVAPASDPGDFFPIPDRWRLATTLGLRDEPLWDPYNFNLLKGDRPLFDDWFVVLSGIADLVAEPRSLPTPVGVQTTQNAGQNDLFGGIHQSLFVGNFITSLVLVKGSTTYKPPDVEIRFTPVFNINHAITEERRVLLANPALGQSRTDGEIGLQELFFDKHLQNVSTRYDFDSLRVGIQPFSSDFRGFLFQDNQLGVRVFGNRDNNHWQYNLAWFRRIEKDINSGLNDFAISPRDDDLFVANLYHQDFPVLGFTSQATVIHNRNREKGVVYDDNGFLARPASLGDQRPRSYDVTYLGLNGDGRIGRYGLTASFYYALGEDRNNSFTSAPANIRAFFAAAEPSVDFSWVRLRGSLLYASGDTDPYDNTERGFDAIFENPQFAGGDTSYWIRQSVPLIGGGIVGLSPRNGILPSLRSSKEQGQSNFINPGITLLGLGTDLDVLPELRLSANVNELWFNETESLEALRQQGGIDRSIGTDLSVAAVWRPFMTQNIVFRLSGAALIAGDGFKDLYGDQNKVYYSILSNLVLTY